MLISFRQITDRLEDLSKPFSETYYPTLRDFKLIMFSMFSSTYTCEGNFSIMKIIYWY